MQLDFLISPFGKQPNTPVALRVGDKDIPVYFVRSPKARRYILRMRPDGSARVTVPRGGSLALALAFAEKHTGWISKQHQQAVPHQLRVWQHGSEILYRGQQVVLAVEAYHNGNVVRFADLTVAVTHTADVRPSVERHLWRLACAELPTRTRTLASQHALTVKRTTVRNQRSRWGSCSRRGTISLNWRLILMPNSVGDYIILHELMHLKEMNHSWRFWQLVEQACPHHAEARKWITSHRHLLRG